MSVRISDILLKSKITVSNPAGRCATFGRALVQKPFTPANAIDLHIHSKPSLFKRSDSDLDMAQHAADNHLDAILLKNHFESTVGRAFLADHQIDDTRVFGGLVLNHFTGGLNPVAVEHAIRFGAKQIRFDSSYRGDNRHMGKLRSGKAVEQEPGKIRHRPLRRTGCI